MTDLAQVREALMPCPFCGGTNLEIRSNGIGDYYVICYSDDRSEVACGSRTGDRHCETEEGAIRRWNCRPSLPEGWKLVPVEPTQAMKDAAETAWGAPGCLQVLQKLWPAMISAAPPALAPEPETGEIERLTTQIEGLEALRPVWAHGFSDDGVAAQTFSAALAEIWNLLGVTTQTEAMIVLRRLVGDREKRPEPETGECRDPTNEFNEIYWDNILAQAVKFRPVTRGHRLPRGKLPREKDTTLKKGPSNA